MIIEVNEETIRFVVEILNESYRGEQGWTTERGLVSGERATETIIRTEIRSGYQYYLYKQDTNYIGCFNLSNNDSAVEIGGFGIKANYQGAGLGKALLNQAETLAKSTLNTSRLIVSVLEPRKELINFYERRGYRLTDKKYPFPQHRGVGVPLIDNLQVVVLEKII